MPNRIIRESCRTSHSLALLSADAERLFWRLTTVADDYGRFQADTNVIRAACFPLMLSQYSASKTARLLQELVTANLIAFYAVGERQYAHFLTWEDHQRKRHSQPKYPSPPQVAASGGDLPQAAADCRLSSESRVVSTESSKYTRVEKAAATFSQTIQDQDFLKTLHDAYPRLDLNTQFGKMRAWLAANPKRGKRDWKRFINGWLAREQQPPAVPKSLQGLAEFAKTP